jgi:hypothetical protein
MVCCISGEIIMDLRMREQLRQTMLKCIFRRIRGKIRIRVIPLS